MLETKKLTLGLQIPPEFSERINELSYNIDAGECSPGYMKDFITSDLLSIAGKKIICDLRGPTGKQDMENELEFYYPDVYEMFYSSILTEDKAEELTADYLKTANDFADWVSNTPEVKDLKQDLEEICKTNETEYLNIELDNNQTFSETNTAIAAFTIKKHTHF